MPSNEIAESAQRKRMFRFQADVFYCNLENAFRFVGHCYCKYKTINSKGCNNADQEQCICDCDELLHRSSKIAKWAFPIVGISKNGSHLNVRDTVRFPNVYLRNCFVGQVKGIFSQTFDIVKVRANEGSWYDTAYRCNFCNNQINDLTTFFRKLHCLFNFSWCVRVVSLHNFPKK